ASPRSGRYLVEARPEQASVLDKLKPGARLRDAARSLTMKWSKKTAQGFSPGLAGSENRPESGGRRNRLIIQDGRGTDGGTIRDDCNVETTAPNSAATFRAIVTYA